MNDETFEGGCLCSATRFRVSGEGTSRCYCHCNSCRRASGAPIVAWVTFAGAEFRVTRGALAQRESSPGILRGFCSACGSSLTYRNQQLDQIDVSVVAMDRPEGFPPEYHIWVSDKLPWVSLHDDLPQFAEWRKS